MKNSILKMLALIGAASLMLSGCGNSEAATGSGAVIANTEASTESTAAPTEAPKPTATAEVTEAPAATDIPEVTAAPTEKPTEAPKVTAAPAVTAAPTAKPTAAPTAKPTEASKPTQAPTTVPTAVPTAAPTEAPAADPTAAPTEAPTLDPTEAPPEAPTTEPVVEPEPEPEPEATEAPAPQPTPSYQIDQSFPIPGEDDKEPECNHEMIESWLYYPTCETHGYVNYVCRLCYYTDHEWSGTVPATGHTPEAYVAHVGDCVDPTIIRYRCSVCGSNNVQDEEEVPTENPVHNWQTGLVETLDPNTLEPIYTEVTGCTRCGLKKE